MHAPSAAAAELTAFSLQTHEEQSEIPAVAAAAISLSEKANPISQRENPGSLSSLAVDRTRQSSSVC